MKYMCCCITHVSIYSVVFRNVSLYLLLIYISNILDFVVILILVVMLIRGYDVAPPVTGFFFFRIIVYKAIYCLVPVELARYR